MKVAPNRKHEPKMSEAVLRQAGNMRKLGKCICARNVDKRIGKEQICSSLTVFLGFLGCWDRVGKQQNDDGKNKFWPPTSQGANR